MTKLMRLFTELGALAAAGAHVQRPLWASTSTKNAAYSDTLYADNLIGPDTMNTPEVAIADAFAHVLGALAAKASQLARG